MSKLRSVRRRTLLLAVACVAVGALLGPPLTTAANEKIQNVFVTNGAADPVPTSAVGTTQVQGTVGIAGTPTVQLGGQPIQVMDAGPAPEPVQFHFTLSFSGSASAFSDAYQVPEGKRLEIQFVSFHDLNRTVGLESVQLLVQQGGQNFNHFLATSPQAGDGEVVSQQIVAYADGGTNVRLFAQLDQTLGGGGATHFMHGYFAGVLTDA